MNKAVLFWLWKVLPLPKFVRAAMVWIGNPKFLVSVDALIFNAENACLLFNHPYRQDYTWGLPGGYLKRGEHPQSAIQREVFEESGLEIQVIKLLDTTMSEKHRRITLIYLAEIVGEVKFTPSVEVSEFGFFPADHLPDLFPNQKALIQKYSRQP
ncbi:MAG: NUDIX hydrolase [Brevefilum fermentans]|uniref:NUDIX hydrolase n=1 Tax=Candidatus Brevifilum fermentans TaxID=1986204 RepID=A0A1Y6K5U4_9CHLR|nr:NUDIX domain-containing protein [Brevefilum fermentans]MDI9566212.1 NUDIX domain-containing protein [Chloroflexota bacterium]SMX53390.1 NUDIX hydrolase [Brevefilum fermentans]HOM67172.1 NUDIX domain-containing protein [Brevefilum fermentans]